MQHAARSGGVGGLTSMPMHTYGDLTQAHSALSPTLGDSELTMLRPSHRQGGETTRLHAGLSVWSPPREHATWSSVHARGQVLEGKWHHREMQTALGRLGQRPNNQRHMSHSP
mmetsp:Transcript_59424/g.129157  ORF Transcript_59424/g.129157 Transcript_59424/m.129157 type:complete len:113 (+) Transcript_59424:1279-1617(+)